MCQEQFVASVIATLKAVNYAVYRPPVSHTFVTVKVFSGLADGLEMSESAKKPT